jgi:signal transduction histidine kinase
VTGPVRLSVTARLALLAILVSLASSFVLIAVIRQQVTSDALTVLQRDIGEQAATYRSVARSGGLPALRRAIANAAADDDEAEVAALYDRSGRLLSGNGPRRMLAPLRAEPGMRIETIGDAEQWDDDETAFVVQRAGAGYLVTGRLLGDRERGERAIERALLWALGLSLVLGVASGLIVTRYVTARLGRIAQTADRVAAGELSRRVTLSGGGDVFDRLGSRVNLMLDRVERLMSELRLVTDSLGHDLRSPLARVRGRIESALIGGEAGREAALGAALAETDALLRMLATLLEIGRSEAIPRDRLAPADPVALVQEIGELYAPVVEDAGRTLAVVTEPVPPLPLHRELLSQAIGNLLDNALKHGSGAIALSLAAGEGTITFAVADRGAGIAAADQAEALSRFGRLDPARSAPGAGLGLALVEAVARLHGGHVALGDNCPGLIAEIVIPESRA